MYQELLYVVNHQLGKREVGNDKMSHGDLIVYGQKVWTFVFNFSLRYSKFNYLEINSNIRPVHILYYASIIPCFCHPGFLT